MSLYRRLTNLFSRSRLDREIAAELQSHIECRVEENIASGMRPAEARRDALVRFGNLASTREHVAGADAPLGLDSVARDLRYAARQLRRSPGFALTAILTLALGIGANVVVFGVMNSLILKPLNLPGADRLFEVLQRHQGDETQSYPDFTDYRARNSTFADMATFRISEAGLSTGGQAQKTWDYEVSGNYFDMLGVQPQVGRLLHASDERGPGSAPFIVLSDRLWRTRFEANPNVVGTTVELNKHHPFTVIGVAPKTFNGTELFFWPDFWMPMVNEEQVEGYNYLIKRGNHGIYVLGMLKPGVTLQQGTDNLNSIAGQLAKIYPTDDGMRARLVKPGLMGDALGGPARPFLAAIMGLALLVLAAASVNLAGIFAARAADRSRELAIRLSIGSTRGRILRQLLTEALLISLAGGLAGTAVAAAMLAALSRWQPIADFPVHVTVVPDARVYGIAFLLSLASGILPGLLPARQIWRTDMLQALKAGRSGKGKLLGFTLRDALLGVQIMLCAVLVTAALVSLRGMERSLKAPMGFTPQNAVLAEADTGMAGYSDDSAFPVQRRMIAEAEGIAGVEAVGTITSVPLNPGGSNSSVYREGAVNPRPSESVLSAHYYSISPGYLRAADTALVAGRDFTWDDGPASPKVAIVNETFARTMFGKEPAVGRRFLGGGGTLYQIVGIVKNGKYETLTEDPSSAMFFPLGQSHDSDSTLVVRSQLPPGELEAALRKVIAGIDPSMPVAVGPWEDSLALVRFPARVATATLGVMGLLAALLAVTGIFGMAAYSVSKRLRELGIRVALGAKRSQVVRSALGRPLVVLLAGSVAGLVLGIAGSRMLAFLVYEATPRDPLVLAGAVLTMTLLGLVATWIPARRALAVNPAQLLREE